jgi:hypothetical protein
MSSIRAKVFQNQKRCEGLAKKWYRSCVLVGFTQGAQPDQDRVWGVGFRVQGSGFRVLDSGFRV